MKDIRCEECRHYKSCLWSMVKRTERGKCFEPKPPPWWVRLYNAIREWAMEDYS